MRKILINLSLRNKLLVGFTIISIVLVFVGVSSFLAISELEEKRDEVYACSKVQDGVTDIKFIVAHDLKLLMELITTSNKKDLHEFWMQHEQLVKDYDKAYKPLHEILVNHAWNPEYTKEIQRVSKIIAEVHNYRTEILVPVLGNVRNFRNEQLAIIGSTEAGQAKINRLQNQIDEQDDMADAKAEGIFSKINQSEKIVTNLNHKAVQIQDEVSNTSQVKSIIFILVGLFFSVFTAIILSNYIVKSVAQLKNLISSLREGDLSQELNVLSKDELGEITESVNELSTGLKTTSAFAEEIGKGNFDTEFSPMSDKDVLGNSLLNMRSSLVKVAEDEKKRNWATEGLAKFGDILRGNNEGLEVLADNIISGVVKYMNANQGGLFIVNDANPQDQYLELIACYAWNKKKYLHMRIEEGEGLVGQAWQEQDTLYITDVPEDYVSITSGLGDANPNSFLIVPLKVNEVTYGVIELASFNMFEEHHIQFIEKLAESIASTLSTAKTNERTKVLLEQSQQQTEEMRAQEEEMRQNMEEMAATQEEMQRKEMQMTEMLEQMKSQEEEMRQNMEEMEATQEQMEYQGRTIAEKAAESQGILDGINATMATIEFTPDGIVQNANGNFLKTMKATLSDIYGKHHSNFVPDDVKSTAEYKTFWSDLASGIAKEGIFKRQNAEGGIVWLNAIYNPIRNAEGKVVKVIKFATDITAQKEQSERDAATKKLYEGEINMMYEKWYNQLKRMEEFVKSKN